MRSSPFSRVQQGQTAKLARTVKQRYIEQGKRPMADAKQALLDLRIKNHLALALLQRGEGGTDDLGKVKAALRIGYVLTTHKIGAEHQAKFQAALTAIDRARARVTEKVLRPNPPQKLGALFTGPELTSINEAMEVHDAQLDVITINQLERAIEGVHKWKPKNQSTT